MTDLLTLTPEEAALLMQALPGPNGIAWADNVTLTLKEYKALRNRLEAHAKLIPPPMGKDKVWSGLVSWDRKRLDDGSTHNQLRTIVRAKSAAEAVRLLNAAHLYMTPARFKGWWGLTGNREELCQCTEPGVWVKGPEGWVKATVLPSS